MPVILVFVLLIGLCFGVGLSTAVTDSEGSKEMTVAEYYASPSAKRTGAIRLSDGELSILRGQLTSQRRRDTKEVISRTAYLPLLPADTIGSEAAKLVVASVDSPDAELLHHAMEAKDPNAYLKSQGATPFRHVDHISGALIPPSPALSEAAADKSNGLAPDVLVISEVSPEARTGEKITSYVAFGFASLAFLFLGGWVIAPHYQKGPLASKDARGIIGSANLTDAELLQALDEGARLVVFQYTFSVVIMTFKQGSPLHFVRGRGQAIVLGLPYSFATLCAGWWGFPWGPIYSIASIANNFMGGKDVTPAFLAHVGRTAAAAKASKL